MSDGKSLTISAWRKAQRPGVVIALHPGPSPVGGRVFRLPYVRNWVYSLDGKRLFQVYKGRAAWKRARATT